MLNDKYTYTIRDDFGKEFDLEFKVGSNSLFAINSTVEIDDDCIKEVKFVASYEDDVPIGMEQQKSLEITWNMEAVANQETYLADAIADGTKSILETAQVEAGYDIPFDYGNWVRITDGSTIIFEGVQEVGVEKEFKGDTFTVTYNCIGAKTLTALRPIFEELALSFTPISGNNWTNEHTLYALGATSSTLSTFNTDEEYTVYVSKSLSEIKTAINTKAQVLLRKYRRDNTSTFLHSNWWDASIDLYKYASYTTFQLLNNDDARLIVLKGLDPDSQGNTGDYTGEGLLGTSTGSLFAEYDNVYEWYKNFCLNYLCKARFTYATGGVSLTFNRVLDAFTITETISDENTLLMNYVRSITDYGKIKAVITSTQVDGSEQEFEAKRLGVKNNTFYDSKLLINNSYETEVNSFFKRTISSTELLFNSYKSSALSRFYDVIDFGGNPNKKALFKVSDYCRVYLDQTTYLDVDITDGTDTLVGRNQKSGLHSALNKAVTSLFESNQSLIELKVPYDVLKPTKIGDKITFNDLSLLINSTYINTKINNDFTVVSYEYDFRGYATIILFGENG